MKKLQKGDIVRIKSIEWYNKYNQNGTIFFGRSTFNKNMSEYCGQLATIEEIRENFWIKVDIDEGRFFWNSEFFEEEPISKRLDEKSFRNRDEEISNEETSKIEEDKVIFVKKKRGRKPGSKNKPKVIKEKLDNNQEENNIDNSFILKADFSEKEENFSDLLEEYILEKNLSYREGMLLKSILNKDIINFKKFKDYEIIQSKG